MRVGTELIERFIDLLCASWDALEAISTEDSTESIKADWLQANWELVVEGLLRQHCGQSIYLEPYGDGADANGASSRILEPDALPTHSINCVPTHSTTGVDLLNKCSVEFPKNGSPCDRFVTLGEDGWYYEKPPFDMVLVDSETGERVFAVAELEFLLSKAE